MNLSGLLECRVLLVTIVGWQLLFKYKLIKLELTSVGAGHSEFHMFQLFSKIFRLENDPDTNRPPRFEEKKITNSPKRPVVKNQKGTLFCSYKRKHEL
jgi:hypothetical protein